MFKEILYLKKVMLKNSKKKINLYEIIIKVIVIIMWFAIVKEGRFSSIYKKYIKDIDLVICYSILYWK